ncbi:hypothetical protein CLHUN_05490 [Ruminiclostridium hungatei]|uniref:Uncharacterized protein n=1 Tax=Ruminiclostridium hungatei TaxID=48256 RepID=A0A1V4SP13_RUMHU|nr:hypothetical protein [Ruminiclostridium hungatei]OPX45612.1 hypothetical protein CLHUN_05490 [Ruminiclostridium hungatei]
MVKRNDYPRKNYSKDGAQTGEPAGQNFQQKSAQKDGEAPHKENHTRTRPPRDNQQREGGNQREPGQQRDSQRRDNRDNQARENSPRENSQNQHKENYQRNYHRENQNRDNQTRENQNQNREPREPRENTRQHFQRPAIKPRAEETVADIAVDIVRIEKEIELELKEIRSMRLGV